MKLFSSVFAIGLLLLLCAANTDRQRTDSYTPDMQYIKDLAMDAGHNLMYFGAGEPFDLLDAHWQRLQSFQQRLASVVEGSLPSLLPIWADEMDKLADTYDRVGSLTPALAENSATQLAKLAEAQKRCQTVLGQIRTDTAQIQAKLRELDGQIAQTTDTIARSKLELERMIQASMLANTQKVLDAFGEVDNRLQATFEAADSYVTKREMLLMALAYNATLYRDAATNIREQKVLDVPEWIDTEPLIADMIAAQDRLQQLLGA